MDGAKLQCERQREGAFCVVSVVVCSPGGFILAFSVLWYLSEESLMSVSGGAVFSPFFWEWCVIYGDQLTHFPSRPSSFPIHRVSGGRAPWMQFDVQSRTLHLKEMSPFFLGSHNFHGLAGTIGKDNDPSSTYCCQTRMRASHKKKKTKKKK